MEQNVQVRIGGRIAEARRSANLTQEQLAAHVRHAPRTIGAWEGNTRHPRPAALALIAAATGHPVSWFYEEAA